VAQMKPIMLMKRDVMGDYDKAKIWAIFFVLGDALFLEPIYTYHLQRRGIEQPWQQRCIARQNRFFRPL
jgi:hypothetical protein